MRRLRHRSAPGIVIWLGLLAFSADSVGAQGGTSRPEPAILSAFFGLDDALPANVEALCPGAGGLDGLPVIFDREIDSSTLDASDFLVFVGSGQGRRPLCATLRPAWEDDENRTVLLLGDLADGVDDPPVGVEVRGELRAEDGTGMRGVRTDIVVPLEAGPSLVLAEILDEGEGQIGVSGRGGGCPEGTAQVVRLYWAGGVRAPDRSELGDAERVHMRVEAEGRDAVVPFALGDLGDNDNVVDLCFDQPLRAHRVAVDGGTVVDPRGDANPATVVEVHGLGR